MARWVLNMPDHSKMASSKLEILYPGKKIRIPVVIHNYSVHSNAYVAWAPRRMELFPTPEQNNIPLNPFEQLSIHELTHVNQMVALNTGFSKAASYLFGEQFTGLDAALLPLWYLEGDAVFAESALTESGRGRIPAFQKELKAIISEKGEMFKYDKIVNSSYKDYVPNHYQSGFQITTWARAKYGNEIWNKALKKTGAEPFTVNPVNISLRENTGLRKKSLFTEAFDTLKTIWAAEAVEAVKAVEGSKKNYPAVNPEKKGRYINYYSPVYTETESIIAVKTSLSSPPSFVLIDPLSKTEKLIHTPGIIYPFFISYGGTKLVWVELQYDMRWKNREFSVVKIMDLTTGTVRRLSKRSRYLAASISPDGKTISAVENSIDNKTSLVLIDPGTGEVRQAIPSPDNSYLQRPQWSSGGDIITLISLTDDGEGIVSYSPATGTWKTLIQPGREDLQSTFLRNDSLYFISSASGTENLMLLTPEGKVSSVTNSKFGATDFCINSQNLVFSDYSASGNNLGFAKLNDNLPVPSLKNDSASFLINRFDFQTKTADTSTNTSFIPRPYRKWQHLFRFHSWMPFYADLDEITSDPASIRPGLTLMTQNTLSTLISTIGYEYSEEKKNLLHTKITWKGWYPVFETEVDWGNNPGISKAGSNVGDPSEIRRGVSLLNTVSVPLRFSGGRFFQYLRPSFTWEYSNDYIYVKEDLAYDYGQSVNTARIYFSNYYRYAYRDINPRWAQTIDVSYTFAPWDKDIYGTSLTFRTSLYFPGFFPNHSIRLKYENENQDPSKFMYGNKVPLPRGYTDIRSRERELISADYTMPLLYPDLNLASLIYITRIRTSLFYDFSASDGNTYYNLPVPPYQEYRNYEELFRSYGFELLADFHLFRLPFEISGGIQTAWTEANDKPVLKFLLNIDLFGMNIGRNQRRPF